LSRLIPLMAFYGNLSTMINVKGKSPKHSPQAGIRCDDCPIQNVCFPKELSHEELKDISAASVKHRIVHQGEFLCHAGERFSSIYVVHSGFFKSIKRFYNGYEQIIGFQMNGDVIGLDGIASNSFSSDVIALETSEVCLIDYSTIESDTTVKKLHRHFDKVFSREIIRLQNMTLLLGGMNANQKIAAFLINLSKRFEKLSYSPSEFYLRMTRVELASYLGLTNATISRTFTQFKNHGLIKTSGRKIIINDYEKLLSIILDNSLTQSF